MRVTVNERPLDVLPGATVYSVRDQVKPDADVVVRNGGPVSADVALEEGDTLVFIRRGEVPGPEELEHLMAARHTPGVHARLKQAVVGIAGLGGLGSAIAVALARVGVGRLILADFDLVEPSNLNRQQYFVDQIGQPKTEALQSNLARVNPYVEVTTHTVRLEPANLGEIFAGVHVLAEAFDTAAAKAMLMEHVCTKMPAVPLVMATGLAGHEPANTVVTRRLRKNVYVCGDGVTAAGPGKGLMAPRVGVAAHHQANAVLRLLLGEDPVA